MKIKLKIPATTANFGSGFDVFGAALKLYNEIEITATSDKRQASSFEIIGEGSDSLPKNEKNIIWQAMKLVFKKCQLPTINCQQKFTNNIPLARGLGSSAAARLGGLMAANILCDGKLSNDEIICMATQLEGHPDNVVPALSGGLCVCNYDGKNVKYAKFKMPDDLKAVLCIPDFELSTDRARKILPKKVSHKDAVFNLSRVAMFISAIVQKKYEFLSLAMEDKLHQPYRKKLIPGLDDVFKGAKNAGALGVCISGSGPTIIALVSEEKSGYIGRAMVTGFSKHKIESRYIVCDFDNGGIIVRR